MNSAHRTWQACPDAFFFYFFFPRRGTGERAGALVPIQALACAVTGTTDRRRLQKWLRAEWLDWLRVVVLRNMVSGGLVSVRFMIGLDELKVVFMILWKFHPSSVFLKLHVCLLCNAFVKWISHLHENGLFTVMLCYLFGPNQQNSYCGLVKDHVGQV